MLDSTVEELLNLSQPLSMQITLPPQNLSFSWRI